MLFYMAMPEGFMALGMGSFFMRREKLEIAKNAIILYKVTAWRILWCIIFID